MEYKLEKDINDRISSVESERYRWRSFGSDVVFDKQKENLSTKVSLLTLTLGGMTVRTRMIHG